MTSKSEKKPVARRRGRVPDPRTKRVNLAYNSTEYKILSLAAKRAGLAPASYAAKSALAVAANDVDPLPMSDAELIQRFQQADTSLNRIGNNLNQIARALNSDEDVASEQLTAVLERVAEAAVALMNAGLDVAQNRAR